MDDKESKKVKRGFSEEEGQKLKELVRKHGTNDWTLIARKMSNKSRGITRSQCKKAWEDYFNPDANKEEWNQEEDNLLFKLLNENNTNRGDWDNITSLFNGEMKKRNKSYKARTKTQIRAQFKKVGFTDKFKEFKNKKTTDLCLDSRIKGIVLGNIGRKKELNPETLGKIKKITSKAAETYGVGACGVRVRDPNEEEKQLMSELKDKYNLSPNAIDHVLYRNEGFSESYYNKNKKDDKINSNALFQAQQSQKVIIEEPYDSSLNVISSIQSDYTTADDVTSDNSLQIQQNQKINTVKSSDSFLNMTTPAQCGHITASSTVPNGFGCFLLCPPTQQIMPLQQILPINPQFGVLHSNQNFMNTLYNNLSMANNSFGSNDKSIE